MSRFLKHCLFSGFLFVASNAANSIILNPDPAQFTEDTGAEIFSPSALSISVEIFDILGDINPGAGSEFGFYFTGTDVNDSTNLITIFDSADQLVGSTAPSATIDFNAGVVFDNDASAVQNFFR